jgi:phosphatidylserine/phosphatidylglycerophosphate/cardiolipin synthase-like enzyme
VDKTVALVGSTNFSTSSLVYNNEANWLFSDSGLGSVFSEYSDSLWSSDSEFSKISKNPVQWITLIGDAQYADIAVPVIESSKARIRLIMYQMTYENDSKSPCDKLINALINADKKGVDVKVILEKSSFDSNLNASNTNAKTKLVSGGVEVRFDTVETTTHAKLLVVDDAVIVYSGNWIYSGLTKNHEAGAMVNSPEFSEQAESYFNNIWNVLE